MNRKSPPAICIFASGDSRDDFRDCLRSVIKHTSLEGVHLHMAFSRAPHDLHYALGLLCPDRTTPLQYQLPGGTERLRWIGSSGATIRAWQSSTRLSWSQLVGLVIHDEPVETDFAVILEQDYRVHPGWWEALVPLMKDGVDYVGQPAWHDYLPAEMEMIQARSWYLGIPFERREAKFGVSFMKRGFMVVRPSRLHEANFPEANTLGQSAELLRGNGEILLGEIAHQLGWTRANHDQLVKPNVM